MAFLEAWKLNLTDARDMASTSEVLRSIAGLSGTSAIAYSYYASLTLLGMRTPTPHADVGHIVDKARQVVNSEALVQLLEHLLMATSLSEIHAVVAEFNPAKSKSTFQSHMQQSDTELFSSRLRFCIGGEANLSSPVLPKPEWLTSTADSPLKPPAPRIECVVSDYEDDLYCDALRNAL